MGILLEKGDKNGKILDIENYSEALKLEILEFFSRNILYFTKNEGFQEAISYVENSVEKQFEIPLRNNSQVNGSLNKLIINEKTKFINFFVYLKEELLNCQKFYFVVSFIKYSGIQLLINTLDELDKKGIEGEIITSVYLNITDPKALRKLYSYKNIKVRIYNNPGESFHTKAYMFQREKYSSCIIGSSNISQSALYSAEEWNVKLTDTDFLNIYDKSLKQFRKLWNSNDSIDLSEDFIKGYENYRDSQKTQKTFDYRRSETERGIFNPNSMQKEILEKLDYTRKNGKDKGLVVAATGTGKTYLAAMDVANFHKDCKKEISFLFIAHREELLENAINVFSKLLNMKKEAFGRIYGGKREVESNMIFASVQSLKNCYDIFSKNDFNYIIVDEFHHAAANSYRKIIKHFTPKFLLGLTATPERMDGKDILEICGYNLVGEIGLKKAMEKELISPFHYFGVDDTIDYRDISYENGKYDEFQLTSSLNVTFRSEYIIEKINKFGYDGKKLSGIAYCQNIQHALYMKNEFSKFGYITEVIVSKTNSTERSNILKKFEKKEIEILCVVDILNEGIDVPDINLLLFLRPTLSSTVFIQQLGRGLRKSKSKDFVTIIDFIGNHRKDYLITKVFSEEINNKNFLYDKKEKIINEIKRQFSNIPGASYIELDRICQERIIDKIEKINFTSKNFLKNAYLEYKAEIGKSKKDILDISDFGRNIDLFREFVLKTGSFYDAQIQFENSTSMENYRLSHLERDFLAYMERKITLNEPFTFLTINLFLKENIKNNWKTSLKQGISKKEVLSEYMNYFLIREEFRYKYLIERILKEMEEEEILSESKGEYFISEKYSRLFSTNSGKLFKKRLEEIIVLGLNEFKKNNIGEFNNNILFLHREYMRTDLQILLDSKVPKGSWRAGYANTETDICLFITNDKSHIIQENLKYDNSLHADDIIQWISQPKTFHQSSVGQMFIKHEEMGMKVHIFARKYAFINGNRTNPFIYLGRASYYRSFGDKPMTILWKLENSIPSPIMEELYK